MSGPSQSIYAIVCISFFFLHDPLAAVETIRLPITKDVGICAHPSEILINTGGQSRIRIKGNEHYYLFDFDPSAILRWRLFQARLHIKVAHGHLRRVATCTVPTAWMEGTASGKPQADAPCFQHSQYPKRAWDPHGGTMLDATFNNPHMIWSACDVIAMEDGWIQIPIDPQLVAAVTAGLSHGLVLAEEKGQTRENHDLFTREQSNAKPYLIVEGVPDTDPNLIPDRRPAPQSAPCPAAAGLTTGAVRVDPSWARQQNILGHRITIGDQQQVTFHNQSVLFEGLEPEKSYPATIESWIGPRCFTSVHPVQASPALATPTIVQPVEVPRLKSVHTQGWIAGLQHVSDVISPDAARETPRAPAPIPAVPRNAWMGLSGTIHPPKNYRGPIRIEVKKPIQFRSVDRYTTGATRSIDARPEEGGSTKTGDASRSGISVDLYRIWSVKSEDRYYPEVLVPLRESEPFHIPWRKNAITDQTNQSILIDIWIPKETEPGRYSVPLHIGHAEGVLELPIEFDVTRCTLPDTFHIIGDMNTYGSPASAMGIETSDRAAFLAMERSYYRLAHAHRMTLNVLPYSQSGGINWLGAPEIEDDGDINWSAWDARYGPLLDGSAFATRTGYIGPGAGIPIDHLYLPFHENWPERLADHFQPWPPPKDYDTFLKWTADLPPIDRSIELTMPYRIFTEHLSARGWLDTWYQVYLNNKYYFRDQGGRGISLWLLDEPMFPDDFLALRWFGQTMRDFQRSGSTDPAQDRLQFRIDISRPTHQRNWLDGLVDLNVCADQLYSQRRLVARRKQMFGEIYWNYHMPPSFTGSNIGWACWPIRSYCWGATGTLPWQTIGSDGDLETADATALLYPGRQFGHNEPFPSLRMKAWRQGLQTAELLRMLRDRKQWTDIQLRAFVGQAGRLHGWQAGMDPDAEDAIVTFGNCGSETLEILRRAAMTAYSN